MSKSNVKVQLSLEHLNLVIQALLFSSSVNVCADWSEDQMKAMVQIATQLKGEDHIDLAGIYIYDEAPLDFEDTWTKDIVENFKNCIRIESTATQKRELENQ